MSALVFNSGMTGGSETSLLNAMPGTGQGSDKNTSVPPLYQSEPIQPKLMPSNIDVSTRRNVLPCKGITHYVAPKFLPTHESFDHPKALSMQSINSRTKLTWSD